MKYLQAILLSAFVSLQMATATAGEVYHPDPGDGHAGIQQIIDNHAPGVKIILDSAIYKGSGIDLKGKNSITMVGQNRAAGKTGTIIKLEDNANSHLVKGSASYSCLFKNIRFDGNKANNRYGDAFYADGMWNTRFVGCDFRNAHGNGLTLECKNGNADDMMTVRCRFSKNGGVGLYANSPAARHTYPNVGNNAEAGIFVPSGRTSVQIHGAQIYGNDGPSLKLGNISRCVFSSIHIEGAVSSKENRDRGIEITGGLSDTTIRDVILVGNFSTAVLVKPWAAPVDNCTIENVKVHQGVSPSGRIEAGAIKTGFQFDEPKSTIEGLVVDNCGTTAEGSFGNAAWDINNISNGLTITNCQGFVNRNRGEAKASDGSTIAHDLDERPRLGGIRVWTRSKNRATATSVDKTEITIGLADPSGNPVKTPETIYFEAKAPSAK